MSEDLKPCPFCNDPMHLGGGGTVWQHVNQGDCIIGQMGIPDDEKQIARWNRRALPTAEALRAQVRVEMERRMMAEADLELWREAKEKADISEERAKAERDSFRAVLEGASYGDIDGIARNTPEKSRQLGEEIKRRTISLIAERDAALAKIGGA